ncbi:MAG: lytic transglycosylase domain-containing protein [Crocinitomicaceae bacterium]|nr:lytic transglycosylase domain-containing protein [Crocinitomicaceae bacterium]
MQKIGICYSFVVSLVLLLVGCSENKNAVIDPPKKQESPQNKSLHFNLPKLPKSVAFCGEEILLDNFDVRERMDKELIINAFYHSSTIQILKRANRYFPEIEKILKEKGMHDDMKYLCVIESALSNATSPSGAKGFWQFMKPTGKEFGLTINNQVDERFNLEKSTGAACQYLENANRKFGNWVSAAASYNCGMGGLSRAMEAQQTNSFFDLYISNETTRYIFRILAFKIIMENPEEYGFNIKEMELYEPVNTRAVEVDKPITNLSDWAVNQGSNLRMLKLLNPWLVNSKLTINPTSYTILLPE